MSVLLKTNCIPKAKKGRPVPVTVPRFGNPSASYGPRRRQAGQPEKGGQGDYNSG